MLFCAVLAPRRCHIILANLRPAGAKGYVIPRGFLFNFITCPNYTGGRADGGGRWRVRACVRACVRA